MGGEAVEEGAVEGIALGVVLDGQAERVVAQADLFDDVVVGEPGFDFHALSEAIDGLVMGAVDLGNLDGGVGGVAEGLDVVVFVVVVVGDVEVKGAVESDIQDLESAADGEDGKFFLKGGGDGGEFPGVALGVGILNERGIGDRLAKIFLGDVGTAGEEESGDFVGDGFGARVPEAESGVLLEDALKRVFIAFPDPCGDCFQAGSFSEKKKGRSLKKREDEAKT